MGSINICSYNLTTDLCQEGGRCLGWEEGQFSHLQGKVQRPRLRDGLLFAEPPSQMVYGAGITPQPEKFSGTACVLEGMSDRPGPALRDRPRSEAPAHAMLLTAQAPPARTTASCRERRERETGLLRPPRSWWCCSVLRMGDRSMPGFLPDFAPASSLTRTYCLFKERYGWSLFVFRSLEAFGQETPVDESLLLVSVLSKTTCKPYAVSAHLSLQRNESWLVHPGAGAIWFGTYSVRKTQRLHVFH